MKNRRPQQNPCAALAITLCLLAAMACAGLHLVEWRAPSNGSNLHGFFVPPPEKHPALPIACRVPPQLTDPQPLAEGSAYLETQELAPIEPEEAPLLSETEPPLQLPTELAYSPPPAAAKPAEPQPVAPRPIARDTPTRLSSTPPKLLHAPHPDYPPTLRASRRSGSVQVRIHIDASGKPTAVDILNSSHPAFAEAARRCILGAWRFAPALSGGRAQASTALQTIRFSL